MNRKTFWLGAAILTVSLIMFAEASYNAGAIPTAVYGAWLMVRARSGHLPQRAARLWMRAFTGVFTAVIAVYLVFQGVCVTLIFHAHSEPPARSPDTIVVLGAGFWGDTLSVVLEERLDTAYALHRRYPKALLVLSGGKGFGEQKTEAELMRAYLTEKGVSDSALLLEDQAMNTVENFRNSKALLDARLGAGNYASLFVTSEFHIYRSCLLARRAGFSPACDGTDTWWFLLPAYLTRETIAILHDLVF